MKHKALCFLFWFKKKKNEEKRKGCGESETLHRFPINDPESPGPLVGQGSRSQHPSAQALVRGRGLREAQLPDGGGECGEQSALFSMERIGGLLFGKKGETAVLLVPD